MRSSMRQTLGLLVMLGICKGLTLTRDENIAVSMTEMKAASTPPARATAVDYPLNAATGISTLAPITIAFGNVADEYLLADVGTITITCTDCVVADDGTKSNEVRTIRAQDSQLQVMTYVSSGKASVGRKGYATITPMKPWLVGVHTAVTQATLFRSVSVKAGDTVSAAAGAVTYTFTTIAECKSFTTQTTCTTGRPDCMWTVKAEVEACEAEVVVVSGSTIPAGTLGSALTWHETTGGDNGIQFVADGIAAGAVAGGTATQGQPTCANGAYISRGMHNGKPMYSQDWSTPVKHGGSLLQYEVAASVSSNGFRTTAGWVLVCGGGPRHAAPVEDVHVTATTTAWTAVAGWADGAIKVNQATCTEPLGTKKRAPYGWATTQPANALARGSFGPAISCAPGYSGSAKATNCPKNGVEYTLSGCTKNSSRRRRRKHSDPWPNNKNDAAPWNPWAWLR